MPHSFYRRTMVMKAPRVLFGFIPYLIILFGQSEAVLYDLIRLSAIEFKGAQRNRGFLSLVVWIESFFNLLHL